MIKWIIKEIKISLKSPKNIILLFFVVFSIFAFITNEKLESNINQTTLDKLYGNIEYNENSFSNVCSQANSRKDDFCDYLSHEIRYAEMYLESFLNEDSKLYHKLNYTFSTKYLYDQIEFFEEYIKENQSLISEEDQKHFIDTKSKLAENRVYYIEDYDDNGLTTPQALQLNLKDFFSGAVKADYIVSLIENDIGIIERHDITPVTFLINYLNTFGVFLIIVALLVNFDIVSRDFNNGSIKNIFSTTNGRLKYFIVKIISAIIVSLIIILIPIILTFIILTFLYGDTLFSHPVLIYEEGFKSLKEMVEYKNRAPQELGNIVSNYQKFAEYGPLSRIIFNLNESFNFTFLLSVSSAWVVTYHVIMFFVLFIIVIVIFSYCIGISTASGTLTLIFSLAIFGVGLLISTVTIGSLLYKLNPFTYIKIMSVIEPTIPSTYLFGLLVLSVSLILLSIYGYFSTLRKNIYV